MRSIFQNTLFEYLFILFPFCISLFYFTIKSFSSFDEELIFLFFLFFFGETHFAATYLFFLNKENHLWIKKNIFPIIIFPIILLVCYILVGLKNLSLAILIGSIASGIHVTRQSIGIQRIYDLNKNKFYEFVTYFFSFLFLFVGFYRFYLKNLLEISNLNQFNYLIIDYNLNIFYFFILFLGIIIAYSEKTYFKKKIANVTGVLIYSPYLFTETIFDAVIIGVSAHWLQYLAINYKIYFTTLSIFKNSTKIIILSLIIVYTSLMSFLGYKMHFDRQAISYLLLIPLTTQFFHYYIDAFIWRFSDPHIRDVNAKKLFI